MSGGERHVSGREPFDLTANDTHTHMQTHAVTREQVSKSLAAAGPDRPGEEEAAHRETGVVEKYCC